MTFEEHTRIPVRINALPTEAAESPSHLLDAALFATQRLGLELDPRQTELLRSSAKRGILNCSRQWGKSTMAAVKAVHRAYTRPNSLILIASPSERQSKELLRKAIPLLAALHLPLRGDGGSDPSLVLPNGSRIVGLPATEATVRGFSAASLLLLDEASRMSDNMYRALRPMLAVGDGDLWMMSTPAGRSGFFYDAWTHGGEDWFRLTVPATDCPRIRQQFLEEERNELGPAVFDREYMCAFTDTGSEMFSRQVVEDALTDDQPWPI